MGVICLIMLIKVWSFYLTLHKFCNFSFIQIEGLGIDGVVYCTDCEALSGRLEVCDFGLYK